MEDFTKMLSKENIFVKFLESNNIPYHSKYMINSARKSCQDLKKIIPCPKLRPKCWISTSLKDEESLESQELKYASAEYFANNLSSPVYFYDKLNKIPDDAIVVEIGPHPQFAKVIKDTLSSVDYITLIKKDSNDTNLEFFLRSIGRLHELGLNPFIENLYTKFTWPVARGTQSVSSLMSWDHSKKHEVKRFPEHYFRPTASDMNWRIDLDKKNSSFLTDHRIDSKIIYPATGYLMLAWRQMANYYSTQWNKINVVFEEVQFRKPLFIEQNQIIVVKVRYFEETGDSFKKNSFKF